MAEPVVLDDAELRQLANIIYYQEAEAIKNIQFKSEPEVAKYLDICRSNNETILGLLDSGSSLEKSYEGDTARAPIAHDVFDYIRRTVNFSLQIVRNYTIRQSYLAKLSEHTGQIKEALTTLDPENVTNVRRLAKEAAQYKNAMLEYNKKYQSFTSREYSKWLKETGTKFDELVTRYQAKLGFEGPFEKLENAQKIQVYEEIMEASGRGKVVVSTVETFSGAAGLALLLVTAGIMVWDIFSAEHPIETATRDAVSIAAGIGGAALGAIVQAAVATELAGIEGTAFFVTMVGFVTGFVGAFVLGAIAGLLLDLIFGSGGTAPLSTEGHVFYVAPMPDGLTLARQIHHSN